MTGVARVARWTAGGLAGLGMRDLAGALAVVLIVVVAVCWVLADEDRSRRLAEIIGAWRGTRPRPVGQPTGNASGRRPVPSRPRSRVTGLPGDYQGTRPWPTGSSGPRLL